MCIKVQKRVCNEYKIFGSTTTTYTTIASVHVLFCVGCCTCQNNSKNRQQSGCIHTIHANVLLYVSCIGVIMKSGIPC